MPLAPRACTVFASEPPPLVQALGTGNAVGLELSMSCIGTSLPISPANLMSARTTPPQLKEPSPKTTHSCRLLLLPSAIVGNWRVTWEESNRRPSDPVSTRTSGMFWQVDVPGTQMVTVVNSPLG